MNLEDLLNKSIHPFILAIYPLFFMYGQNIQEVSIGAIFLPLFLVLVSTILAYTVFLKIFGDSMKAAVVTSAVVTSFFSFNACITVLEYLTLLDSYYARVGFIYALLLVSLLFISFIVWKTERKLVLETRILNIFSIILLSLSLFNVILSFDLSQLSNVSPIDRASITDNRGIMRDIYYIILDEYGRADSLYMVFDFNNSGFISELKDRGFYVASKSRSNYAVTYLSLASSLNMQYINYLEEDLGTNCSDRSIPYRMIKDNRVVDYLKSQGYTYINLKSTWGPTEDMGADIELGYTICGGNTEFYTMLLYSTALQPFLDHLIGGDLRKSRIYAFDKLGDIASMEEPTFTFAHMILPHAPYLFDRQGKPPANCRWWDMGHWGRNEEYINQLVYTNKKIIEVLDEIFLKSDKDPIIIIQADHGTRSENQHRADDIESLPPHLLQERMAILNTYYLPGCGDKLYDSISPVNSFYLIFNNYFNERYIPLEDISYFSTVLRPYDFIEVSSMFEK